ncbi:MULTISPECIES: Tex family protein [Bacteroides]|uniref:Tex family protein n=1 Tax=Bacteroides sp. TaxID=29523 RepID=UPI001D61135A|nr:MULTISPECIES: Tex family protein [Bacteroides]HJD91496.1 RNA-binding transcriptional accessory protein [Bacteroides coprosuis]
MTLFNKIISNELNIAIAQISHTVKLLQEGASIPFISRYRKEATGGLDEVQIEKIAKKHEELTEIEKRRTSILSTIEEQGALTPELKKRIENTWELNTLEDIYLPYKPKRRTRAEIARNKGLEPLAHFILLQQNGDYSSKVAAYLSDEVATEQDALDGAQDIIAEQINENETVRNITRQQFDRQGLIESKVIKGKEEEGEKYRDYFDFSEPLKRITSYRLLAIRRAEAEKIVRVSITPNYEDDLIDKTKRYLIKGHGRNTEIIEKAIEDSYKRLLKPAIETEFANSSKETADDESIEVFKENLKQLLLAPPLGQKRVLGIDPGFRTGCKVVCLDAQGNLLHNENIFPHPPHNKKPEAASKLRKMVEAYKIEAIAIGNGTASRETEYFVTHQQFDRELQVFVVSEQGASIYSASKIAREEFPEYDVTVRGAVSIARRLIDPLAELVKIDPKSIGVGQYQHDVDQTKLKKALDQTVINCVNTVGVDVNTASTYLLTYISGLGPQLAQNIVDYRTENGPFSSRKELLKVPRMGAKTYEQAAGFLRIREGENPLDNTAVHPESYHIVEKMAKDMKCTVPELIAQKELQSRVDIQQYITDQVGLPTLKDIMSELKKPGRDPRKAIKVFQFDQNIRTIEDLKEGMILPGIVGNITNFGAFVDLGIKENGLIHLSEMANEFVSDPTQYVSIHQQIYVKVLSVDLERKRIQLSLKNIEQNKL